MRTLLLLLLTASPRAWAGPAVSEEALQVLSPEDRAELLDEETALALARAEMEAAEAALEATLQEAVVAEPVPTPEEALEAAKIALKREKARRKRGETSDVPGAKDNLRAARLAAKHAPTPMATETITIDDLLGGDVVSESGGASKRGPAKSGVSRSDTVAEVEKAVNEKVEEQVAAQKALLKRARLAFYLAEAELQLTRALAVVAAGGELDLEPYQRARDEAADALLAERH